MVGSSKVARLTAFAAMFACAMLPGCVNDEVIIGVYYDEGVSFDSFEAACKVVEWMGLQARKIDSTIIDEGDLSQYEAIIVPGGNMYEYAGDISDEGMQRLRDFVERGGGYIGICGGGYFASQKVVWRNQTLDMTSLALFSGEAMGPLDEVQPYPRCGISGVEIGKEYVVGGVSKSMSIYYCWGPTFIPDEGIDVEIIGAYEATGTPAAIALEYGRGRVFLSGTHPELSEPEGENWEFLRNAILWCLGEGGLVFPHSSLIRPSLLIARQAPSLSFCV